MSANEAAATFAVDIESNAGEVAPDAASAIEALREQIRGGVDELRGMQSALRLMKGAAGVAGETVTQLKDRIAANKAAVAQQQARYVQLGGTFRNVRKPTQDAVTGVRQLVDAVRAAPGPLSAMAGRLGAIGSIVGGGVATGIVGVAGAVMALTAATAAAAVGLARYGFAQADARRSELLRLEGLSKTRNFWMAAAGFRQVADKASFLQETIDQVSDSVAIGRDKIADYASGLYRAGLRGGNLQAALEGLSIVASTQGDAAADAWKGWALGAGIAGQSIRALTNDVKARLGGIASRQLLSLDVQSRKFKENLGRIFGGVNVEPLLAGISKVTELFSQSTASGRALKTLAETILNPLAIAAGSTGGVVKDMFRGLIISAQMVTIAVLEAALWLKKTFGGSDLIKGIDKTRAVISAVLAVTTPLAGVLTAVAASMLVTAGAFALAAGTIAAIGYGAVQVFKDLMAIDWAAAGRNVIDGIVNGIKSGIQKVKDAITSVGNVIQSVFSTRMMIHSPSKVMIDKGAQVSAGVEGGIDRGRPKVAAAVRRLAAVPAQEMLPERPATRAANDNAHRRNGLDLLSSARGIVAQAAPRPSDDAQASPTISNVIQLFGRPQQTQQPASGLAPTRDERSPASVRVNVAAPAPSAPGRIPYDESRSPAASPPPPVRGPAGRGGIVGPLIELGEFHYHAAPGEKAEEGAENVKGEFTRMLEGLAIQLGAKVA
jgi:hypothetical protein